VFFCFFFELKVVVLTSRSSIRQGSASAWYIPLLRWEGWEDRQTGKRGVGDMGLNERQYWRPGFQSFFPEFVELKLFEVVLDVSKELRVACLRTRLGGGESPLRPHRLKNAKVKQWFLITFGSFASTLKSKGCIDYVPLCVLYWYFPSTKPNGAWK